MALTLFNTLSRSKDKFEPLKKGHVGMYTCGPTVYGLPTIGNLRSYVFADVLRRVLTYNGLTVMQVMNITDVGHLTSDADEGEDKMEKGQQNMLYFRCKSCNEIVPGFISASPEIWKTTRYINTVQCSNCGENNLLHKKDLFHQKGRAKGVTIKDIAKKYTNIFKENLKALNIPEPDIWTVATQHIKEQIKLIQKLEKNGFTYTITDGVYFDTSKLKDYGKLARLDREGLKEGARVEKNAEKKSPTDFALWKFSPKDSKRQMEWDSPWGVGFPGWHIECSAMSMKELGKTFDIHTGGVDHIPVHHTNEIAQSEAATGKPFVKYWLHNEFISVDGKRIGKSEGNTITIDELKTRGFNPLAYRYLLLQTHYRSKTNFTWEVLDAAQKGLDALYDQIARLEGEPKIGCAELEQKFLDAVNDDLNTPQALSVLQETLASNYPDTAKLRSILRFDEVLGLRFADVRKEKQDIPKDIRDLAEQRLTARADKNFDEADRLRGEIEKLGYGIEDTDDEYSVTKN